MHRVKPPGGYRARTLGARLGRRGHAEHTRREEPAPVLVPAGVSLARLTRLARLTPQQALVIAAEVFGQVAERHAEGTAVGGLDEHRVWVGHDGRIELVDAAFRPAARPDRAAIDADVASCRRLLANLGRGIHAGAPPSRSNGASEGAASRLLTSVPDLDGGIAASAVTLRAASAQGTGQATTELAALVSVMSGVSPAALAPGGPRRGAPGEPLVADQAEPIPDDPSEQDVGWPVRARRAIVELLRVAVARWGRWGIAALVLIALLGIELVVFGDRIESDLAMLRSAGRADEGPVTAGEPVMAPVPVPAPPANGPIAAVDLRSLAGCEPGGECATRLQVRFRPGSAPDQVRWAFQLTDRCTGVTWSVPGGAMRVGPGGEQLAVVARVPLPPGRALGVTAVVSTPALAASPPLLAPAVGTC